MPAPKYSTEQKAQMLAMYILGDPPSVIAERMNIPMGSVQTIVKRAKKSEMLTPSLTLNSEMVRQRYEDGITKLLLGVVNAQNKLLSKVADEDKLEHATLTEITQAFRDVSEQHTGLVNAIKDLIGERQGADQPDSPVQ